VPVLCEYHIQCALLFRDKAREAVQRKDSREAARFCEQGQVRARKAIDYESVGQKARSLFFSLSAEGALADLHNPQSDHRIAWSLIDSGLDVDAQDALLHAVKAFYYFRKQDKKNFSKQLERAEKLNEAAVDRNAADLLLQLRAAERQGGEVHRLVGQLHKALGDQRWREGIHLADRILAKEEFLSEDDRVYIRCHKTQCLLRAGRLPEAQTTFVQTKALLRPCCSNRIRSLVDQLEQLLRQSH
jgi:tetratricopeptide (TPR) repeat protein